MVTLDLVAPDLLKHLQGFSILDTFRNDIEFQVVCQRDGGTHDDGVLLVMEIVFNLVVYWDKGHPCLSNGSAMS